jgi:hypothetical protein
VFELFVVALAANQKPALGQTLDDFFAGQLNHTHIQNLQATPHNQCFQLIRL